ncbi:hypothetical protein ACIRRH_39395 [Kitasatospora sp. NPDC101235]|uniref:hypothetical protein n=1 Tax=Kitasatospora sp. NPDC101235 TaxID=3364101 RepID=UPI0037F20012
MSTRQVTETLFRADGTEYKQGIGSVTYAPETNSWWWTDTTGNGSTRLSASEDEAEDDLRSTMALPEDDREY